MIVLVLFVVPFLGCERSECLIFCVLIQFSEPPIINRKWNPADVSILQLPSAIETKIWRQKTDLKPWHPTRGCPSSQDESSGDLLEWLLRRAERVAPSRREPRQLALDLQPLDAAVPRPLLPCHSVPFLNALVQTLLASSLMPLLAQVAMGGETAQRICW